MTSTATTRRDVGPAPLVYAPPPRWHRRRRFRVALLAVLVLGLAGAGWRWGPAGWKHAQFLHWQRQCLAYSPPPDLVVYETDPTRAAALIQKPGYTSVAQLGGPPIAVYTPRCWSEAMRLGGVPVTNTGFGAGGPGATLFLHERTTPSGVRRLVAVHAPAGGAAVVALPIPAPVVVQPATLTAGPSVRGAVAKVQLKLTFPTPSGSFTVLSSPPGTTTRFFAGRPDPANPSRFTIPFEAGGSRGEIEGFLDDGDALRLAITSAPATPPVASADLTGGTTEISGTATIDVSKA